MKFEDLTEEQQEHFTKVVEYCKENGLEEQLEEATHIDFDCSEYFLSKFDKGLEYAFICDGWFHYKREVGGDANLYQKPDKPWYNPEDVSFKNSKLKPQDLECFKEVADVIGYEGAVKELQVVLDSDLLVDPHEMLWSSFIWIKTPQGSDLWVNIKDGVVPESYNTLQKESLELKYCEDVLCNEGEPDSTLEETSKKVVEQIHSETPVSSDGKASSYYWIELPLSERVVVDTEKGMVGFMVEEIIEHALGNDFDRGNIMKANLRVGKKSGNSVEYDANKIQYSAERLKQRN